MKDLHSDFNWKIKGLLFFLFIIQSEVMHCLAVVLFLFTTLVLANTYSSSEKSHILCKKREVRKAKTHILSLFCQISGNSSAPPTVSAAATLCWYHA